MPDTPKLPTPLHFTPVPRKKDRSNGWKPAVQRAFIEALADTGSVAAAARMVGRAAEGAYALRRHPQGKSFRKAWEAALAAGVQRLEDIAMERALNGVEQPVYSYGELVGTRRVYNDRLLMFMLRNRAPKRFAEGRARGLNALDNARLKTLRKQWREECREEWEAERRRVSPQEVRDSIDAKIAAMRQRVEQRLRNEWCDLSRETRDAFRTYHELLARDRNAPSELAADALPEEEVEAILAQRRAERALEDPTELKPHQLPPPGWGEKPEPEPEGERIRTLKDESW